MGDIDNRVSGQSGFVVFILCTLPETLGEPIKWEERVKVTAGRGATLTRLCDIADALLCCFRQVVAAS
jgi:hypothetical protein